MKYLKIKFIYSLVITSLLFLIFPIKTYAQSSTPISLGANVTASNSADSAHGPVNIVDGQRMTTWITSAGSPQWVLIDLKDTYVVNRISLDLYLNDSSKGRAVYNISAGPDPNSLSKVIDLDQIMRRGQHVEIPLLKPIPNVRYLKVSIQTSSKSFGLQEVSVYEGSEPVKNHLTRFGFYYGFYDRAVNQLVANTTEMHYGNNPLPVNYDNGYLTVVSIMGVVFDTSNRHYTLRGDWQTRWDDFVENIKGQEDAVYAIYFDEPTSTHTITQSDFQKVISKIRETYPSMRIMVTEGGSDLITDDLLTKSYLTNVTDLGFDFYFIRNGATNNYSGWGDFLNNYEKVESVAENRRVWLVPEAIAQYSSQLSRLPDVFERYLSFALANDNIAGMLIYRYPDEDGSDNINYTVESLVTPTSPDYSPTYTARLRSVGSDIIDNVSDIATCDSGTLLPGRHDDFSYCIDYSTGNWKVYTGPGPFKGTKHYSEVMGDKASFKFEGTGFSLIQVTNFNRGILKVSVDGQSYDLNQYTSDIAWQSIWNWPTTLSPGVHTVTLEHKSGQYVDLDAIQIYGESGTASPPPTTVPKPGDANGDNKVDGIDYSIWLNHYNQAVTGVSNGDFDNSGKVDGVDYSIWLINYGS